MPDKTKDAKELLELAAEQGEHATKNVAAAGSRLADELLPEGTEGIAFAIRLSNKAVTGLAIGVGAVVGVKVGRTVGDHIKQLKRKRELKKVSANDGSQTSILTSE